MSPAVIAAVPVTFGQRKQRIRASWSTAERQARAIEGCRQTRKLARLIINGLSDDSIWATGALTPDDLERLSS